MNNKFKGKVKVQCPCGKFYWIPAYYVKRGVHMTCSKECRAKYKKKRVYIEKYSLCENCQRKYLTKLGCIFCKNI